MLYHLSNKQSTAVTLQQKNTAGLTGTAGLEIRGEEWPSNPDAEIDQ